MEATRFNSQVDKGDGEGCWLWTGPVPEQTGYGYIWFGKNTIGAHRASYLLHKGPIPKGLVVRHTCHIRTCVNPEHLVLGTPKQNTADSLRAGRFFLKIAGSELEELRAQKRGGKLPRGSVQRLAAKHGVSSSYMGLLLSGRRRP